ncbi:MAG: glycosyltransferase family 2 protein [Solirubrobacterales bacterium]
MTRARPLIGCVNDVCTIIVSHNGKRWLDAALTTLFAHAGDVDLDVVVVDNGADGAAAHVEEHFPAVRTVTCANHGFGHANNRGLETANARYVLFLNPDTEFLNGSLAELTAALDRRPEVGLAGVRQVEGGGALAPSIRRFPSTANMLAEALGVEKVPGARRVLGERELDPAVYGRETPCDWTSGSFMIARREALERAGGFDERFFLFAEETDLCWRIKQAGWEVMHMPQVTIRHYEHEQGLSSRLEAQAAYARVQFARKHLRRAAEYRWALALRYSLRIGAYSALGERRRRQREAARAALATIRAGRAPFAGQAGQSSGDDRQGAGGGAQLDAGAVADVVAVDL